MPLVFGGQRFRASRGTLTSRGHVRMPFVFARHRFRRMAELFHEVPESRLDFARRLSLVGFQEKGDSGLYLERA
jgi:hypothetical protein